MTPRERTIQRACVKALQAKGAYVLNTIGGSVPVGTPDIIAGYRGFFIAVEVKRPGQAPTPIQQRRLQQVREAGGHAIVATNKLHVLELMDALDAMLDPS